MDYDKLENQLEMEQETNKPNKPNKVNINFTLFHLSPITLKISFVFLFTICIIQSTILIVIVKQNNTHNNTHNNIQCLNNSSVNISTQASSSALLVDNNDGSGNLLDVVNNTHIQNITNTTNTPYTENTDNSILCGTRILTFTAGNYTLKPCDYKFAKFITVEMWGGGGAGSSYNGHGGASGGYIKATFPTNLQTFQISVGKGGVGYHNDILIVNQMSGNTKIPNNGSDTIITSSDKKINLIASGGKWKYIDLSCCYYDKIQSNHIPITINNTIKLQSIHSKVIYNLSSNLDFQINFRNIPSVMFGQPGSCDGQTFIYFGNDGGNASFGGIGGRGSITIGALWSDNFGFPTYPAINGNIPGGGGGGSGYIFNRPNYASCYSQYGSGMGNGGDGLINIYF
jgi:hypothetical protein